MTVIIVIIENTLTRLLVGVQIRLLADAGGLLISYLIVKAITQTCNSFDLLYFARFLNRLPQNSLLFYEYLYKL
jgi:hypothetical protein